MPKPVTRTRRGILEHAAQAAGRHDGERLVQLHAELPDRAFDAAEEVVVESGLHRGLRACGENGFRLGDFHLGQLGRLAPQGRRGRADARGDQAAGDHALVIDVVERRGGAEIGDQHRTAVRVIRAHAVGEAVRTQRLRVVDANVDAGFDSGADHHGIDVQELDDACTERVHDLRHDGRDDHVIDIRGTQAAQREELRDHQAVLVGRVVRFRRDSVGADDVVAVQEAENDVGVADVDRYEHANPLMNRDAWAHHERMPSPMIERQRGMRASRVRPDATMSCGGRPARAASRSITIQMKRNHD